VGLPQGVDCLVVAPDQHRQHLRLLAALEVFPEAPQLLVLLGTVHILEVLLVPQRLEIPADDEQVGLLAQLVLQGPQLCVDLVEFSVETALDGNLCRIWGTFIVYYKSGESG
jgi:hypothetical protein